MADRRAEIVRAALAFLREEGAQGLSQVEVAKRAGMRQGHLTYYFPRKADLVAAVARELQQEMHRELMALVAREQPKNAREAAAAVLTAHIADDERSRALLGLTIESERDPEAHDVLIEVVEQGRPLIAALLGPKGDEVAIDLVTAAIWGLELQQLFRRRNRAEVRAVVERLLDWIDGPKAHRTAPKKARKGRRSP